MFNFGRKKDKDEKDKKRKEKKDRKKQFIDSMTQDELSRLTELRKSVTKENQLPSGITADYRDHQSPDPDSTSSNTSSTWSGREGSLGRPTTLGSPPPLPERPPPRLSSKKSILKSKKNYEVSRSVSSDLDDECVLLRNTKDNEYINVYRRSALSPQKGVPLVPLTSPNKSSPSTSSGGHSNDFADRELGFEIAQHTVKIRVHSNHVSPVTPPENLRMMQQSPIKAKDLNGESVGVKQRPLSCEFPLHLPTVALDAENEAVREITVDLVAPGDYGFTVRHSEAAKKKSLIIESERWQAKFAPGDQLVAVNGTNVQELDRDQIQKLIKSSSGASSLILHVSLLFSSLLHSISAKKCNWQVI